MQKDFSECWVLEIEYTVVVFLHKLRASKPFSFRINFFILRDIIL